MDSLTQIVLGASVSGAVGIKPFGRKVLITGALLGTLPDLDVLLTYQTAIEDFTLHRGFSHSLLVLSLFSVFLYWLILYFKPALSAHKKSLFLVIFLPLITHPLLDAFTTYGTQLLWPLDIQPTSWSSIFIIDPLYTLPLMFAVIGLWFREKTLKWQKINRIMLAFSCTYLILGQVQFWTIKQKLTHDPIAKSGHLFIAPTPFNTRVWQVLSYHDDTYYVSFTTALNDQPLSWQTYETGRSLINGFDSAELQRLEWFSGGLLRFTEQNDQLIATDLRIGLTDYYPFSFSIAEDKNNWQEIKSNKMPEPVINLSKLTELMRFLSKI